MSFRIRVLLLLASLIAAVLGVTLFVVNRSAEAEAVAEVRQRFDRSAEILLRLIQRQNEQDAALATLLVADYAFKQAFAADVPTLESNLESLLLRSDADSIAVVLPEGNTLAARTLAGRVEIPSAFAPLVARADAAGAERADGFVWIGDELHAVVLVPLLAPDLVAWVGLGHRVGDKLAANLGQYSGLDVVFLRDGARVLALASTLAPGVTAEVARVRPAPAPEFPIATLAGERFLVAPTPLPELAQAGASVFVLSSLDARLAPTRRLQGRLLTAGCGLLAAALVVAFFFARSLTRPVGQLAAHTRLIAAGDYAARLDLRRGDELGELARAFNAMSTGLAERDRVRDLLDKNVSPEVAASLLRDGSALGGEEREVTVLFADLRGFTTLAEGLAPRDLVALLNRYLDRMSAEIEACGGVVDKYIGDEIMALFGAPVAAPDSADRAVRAALGMRAALAAFNRELAAEGRPPLAFGVGINTAHVVAGNIGSHRRLNYSVIGDGVNLAARLQPLTRRAEFATDIISSDFTRAALRGTYRLRALVEISVKGNTEAAAIHAVVGQA
jgi:adenylate cyclase